MDIKGLIILLFVHEILAENVKTLDSCSRKVEPIGCYRDKYKDRALPIQILNGRDIYSNVYNKDLLDWVEYHAWLQKFICRCAEIAFAKGYKVIGIQFYGECWSGPEGHLTYSKHGQSNYCNRQDMTAPKMEQYKPCASNSIVCSGESLTNYVYRVAPTACDVYYEPVGCFTDDLKTPRPLPNYVMNERDYSTSNWNGKLISWKNWNTYSPEMICRCAKKIKSLGMKTFGLQFYGECWSGEPGSVNYDRKGPSGKEGCLAANFKACPYNSYHCVGKAMVNSVFRLIDGPKVVQASEPQEEARVLEDSNDVSPDDAIE